MATHNEIAARQRRRKRRKRKKMLAMATILVLFLLVIGGIGGSIIYFLSDSKVYKECTVEAGISVRAEDFLKKEGDTASFADGSMKLETPVPGDYPVQILYGSKIYKSVLKVVDTIAPAGTAVDKVLKWGETCTAADLVNDIQDATRVTVSFEKEPDYSKEGVQEVTILLTDLGNNKTKLSAEIKILPKDTEAPVITGARDLEFTVGDSGVYRKDIVVTDNYDENVELQVDATGVDLETEGAYPLIYRAVDASGNATEVAVTVYVSPESYSVAEVYAMADKVLAEIITDDMEPKDKLWAIFKYIRNNVGYINHSEKLNWVQAAYEAFTKKQGDCYVYACVSKVLLDRAGIKNMDIEKIPAKSRHYWNLVDIGEGWYHFDTTPRVDHPTIFYWDDATLMEYSENHKLSHNYDHDLYPKVQ